MNWPGPGPDGSVVGASARAQKTCGVTPCPSLGCVQEAASQCVSLSNRCEHEQQPLAGRAPGSLTVRWAPFHAAQTQCPHPPGSPRGGGNDSCYRRGNGKAETSASVQRSQGQCRGHRVRAEQGPSPCMAPAPPRETLGTLCFGAVCDHSAWRSCLTPTQGAFRRSPGRLLSPSHHV